MRRSRTTSPGSNAYPPNAAGPLPLAAYDISGSVLITAPGTTGHEQVVIPLARGEVYGLVCEFRNADSLPRHSAQGMWKVMTVE